MNVLEYFSIFLKRSQCMEVCKRYVVETGNNLKKKEKKMGGYNLKLEFKLTRYTLQSVIMKMIDKL